LGHPVFIASVFRFSLLYPQLYFTTGCRPSNVRMGWRMANFLHKLGPERTEPVQSGRWERMRSHEKV